MNPCNDCPRNVNGYECADWRGCLHYMDYIRWRVDWEREADPQPKHRTPVRVVDKGEME